MKDPNTLTAEEKLLFVAGVGYGINLATNNASIKEQSMAQIFLLATTPFTRQLFIGTEPTEKMTECALIIYDRICQVLQTAKPKTSTDETPPPADPFAPGTAQSIVFNIGLN